MEEAQGLMRNGFLRRSSLTPFPSRLLFPEVLGPRHILNNTSPPLGMQYQCLTGRCPESSQNDVEFRWATLETHQAFRPRNSNPIFLPCRLYRLRFPLLMPRKHSVPIQTLERCQSSQPTQTGCTHVLPIILRP